MFKSAGKKKSASDAANETDSFGVLNISDGEQFNAGDSFPFASLNVGESPGPQCPPNTWSFCNSSSFNLRVGPNYASNKKKAPSPPSLLEIVGVE